VKIQHRLSRKDSGDRDLPNDAHESDAWPAYCRLRGDFDGMGSDSIETREACIRDYRTPIRFDPSRQLDRPPIERETRDGATLDATAAALQFRIRGSRGDEVHGDIGAAGFNRLEPRSKELR
jgi:hypothetical protein